MTVDPRSFLEPCPSVECGPDCEICEGKGRCLTLGYRDDGKCPVCAGEIAPCEQPFDQEGYAVFTCPHCGFELETERRIIYETHAVMNSARVRELLPAEPVLAI